VPQSLILKGNREDDVNKLGHGRLRRLVADFRGDDAVEIDILEVSLRMGEVARTRMEADTMLVRLAFKALGNAITEYCEKTGARYPSYKTLLRFIAEGHTDSGADDSKIVNLPK
jgi:hypothetical protein